ALGRRGGTGAGLARDVPEAGRWFRQGAALGEGRGGSDLGNLLLDQDVSEEDRRDLGQYFAHAAEAGDPVAGLNLSQWRHPRPAGGRGGQAGAGRGLR
ncbi:MAG: hypothetical protein ABF665_17440, partial [Gluconacetobacter sp.]